MKRLVITAIMTASAAGAAMAQNAPLPYPPAPKAAVSDQYFNITVPDPYRALENDTAAVTLDWVKAENELTRRYLDAIPYRQKIHDRLTRLYNYKKTGLPWKESDGRYYYFQNDGLQNQSVLYRKKSLSDTEAELFLDPNSLSDNGTVALKGVFMSPDGKQTAYIVSRNGSDWEEIYVMDTETRQLLPDHIEWAKFTDAQWWGSGFFYSAYDRPVEGKEFSNSNENHRIYYHRIGTPQTQDSLVYTDPEHPLHFHTAYVPDGTDMLFVYGGGEGFGNSIMMKNLKDSNATWTVIEPTQDIPHSVIDVIGGKIYILTSLDAPRYRLMVADIDNPARENWRELIGQGEGVMSAVSAAGGDKLLITVQQDASDHLYLYDLAGNKLDEIKMPGYGSVSTSTSRKNNDIFYAFTSFTSPATTYSYDPATKKSTIIERANIDGFNFDDYVTEQVFVPSRDRIPIPMFITYKKGIKRDCKNPVYLYGYGGFNVSLPPSFSPQRLLWLENGGIYAQVNLRGGGEYGEEWHNAGTQMNKKNVFNDFIDAASYMIRESWTTPELMAMEGGSNGGLLVGAVANMRPDLFKVAIPRVGVMDMMRYHLFTIGWNWAPDYGTSANSAQMAEYLYSYSPLHNIKNDGTPYPAILVTTADHDDRVVPAHSFKYAAALQAADTGDAPKLIRIDSNAGHGGGKPVSKVIDEYADIYSFIFNNIGRTPAIGK